MSTMLSQSGLNKLKFSKVGYRRDFMKPSRRRLLLWIMQGSMWRSELWKYLIPIWFTQGWLAYMLEGGPLTLTMCWVHELAPIPTSMFDDTGDMRIAKSKSTLKKIIQVEVSDRVAGGANVSVLDGSAILWVVPWPADVPVKDYIANFKYVVGKRLRVENVYLIFDRYNDYSTKSVTRGSRATGVGRVHHLQVNSNLPATSLFQKQVTTDATDSWWSSPW